MTLRRRRRIEVTLESDRRNPREPLYQRVQRARIFDEARRFAEANRLN